MTETTTGRANLEEFSATLLELGKKNKDLLVVTSDSRGSGKLGNFAAELPGQIVEVGIAEQNLVGISAGLASTGKTVFAVSPACFLTTRALEQIKNDVAYSGQPVNIVGISAGVSYGALGTTHHSLHDVAALRAIYNVQVIVPADNFETREAIIAASKSGKPLYLKFGKKAMPNLPRVDNGFEIGRASIVREGKDVAMIACGETVWPAYEAALLLEQENLETEVISMHTIQPLDKEAVLRAARGCRTVITVEEHSIHGGLGESCASLLLQENVQVPFRIVGIPYEDTMTGSQADIFSHYGITGEGLKQMALQLIKTTR